MAAMKVSMRVFTECPFVDRKALGGHIGIVFSQGDIIEMTKVVSEFSEENEKVVQILAGQIDGKFYDAQKVAMLSKLPGKNQMRAEFIGLLEAPMAQTVGILDAMLTSILHCMSNRAENLEKAQ